MVNSALTDTLAVAPCEAGATSAGKASQRRCLVLAGIDHCIGDGVARVARATVDVCSTSSTYKHEIGVSVLLWCRLQAF